MAARGAAASGAAAASSGVWTPLAPLKVASVRVALVHEAVTALHAQGGVEDFGLDVLAAELSRLVAQRASFVFSEDELLSCLKQLEEENKLMWRGGRVHVWEASGE